MMKNQKILDKLGLNWGVNKMPLFAHSDSGEQHKSTFFGIVRSDNKEVLSTCTERYYPSQNNDLIELLVTYFGDDIVEKAQGGPLRGGRKVRVMIPTGERFEGIHKLKSFATFKDSHDGSWKFSIGISDEVLVCENGMTRFEDKHYVSFKHTKSLDDKLKNLDKMYKKFEELQDFHYERYSRWMSTNFTYDMAREAIARINDCDLSISQSEFIEKYSTKKFNLVNSMLDSIELEMNRQGNTAWGFFNGVTHYTNHVIGSEKKDDSNRREETFDGGGYRLNNKAYEYLVEKYQ